jgi:hypothetical protein
MPEIWQLCGNFAGYPAIADLAGFGTIARKALN